MPKKNMLRNGQKSIFNAEETREMAKLGISAFHGRDEEYPFEVEAGPLKTSWEKENDARKIVRWTVQLLKQHEKRIAKALQEDSATRSLLLSWKRTSREGQSLP